MLATESLFILSSATYDTGVPKINIPRVSIGLSAACADILLRRKLKKISKKLVEEYNYNLGETKYAD